MNKDFITVEKYVVDLIKNVESCDRIKHNVEEGRLTVDMKYARKHCGRFAVDFTTISECIQGYLNTFHDKEKKIFFNHTCYPSHDRNLYIRVDVLNSDSLYVGIVIYV